MPLLRYLCLRFVRRQIPQKMIDWMLDRGVFLQPGLDTRAPDQSVQGLAEVCARHGLTLEDKTVCVVGYGGSFGVGLSLLEAGAKHVVLQDPFAPIRHARIRQLAPERLQRYFQWRDGRWEPNPAFLTVVTAPLQAYARLHPASMDLVFSSSVLEHVDQVDSLIEACSQLTTPAGLNVHVIDLRDHYFRYPFEMLCYQEKTWQRWLNSSNLNRLRLPDYERIFDRHFARHQTAVTQSLPAEFQQVKHRIRAEFLTGDDSVDCVGTVRVEARKAA
jgi:hypothetical protein